MFDWKKPTVQMLGRWQPWHDGHQALFKRCIAKTGQVIIQVRDVEGASGGDGKNDNLVFPGIESYTMSTLTLFNRNGEIVFQKSPYDNSFDGASSRTVFLNSNRDSYLPTGTYFYTLVIDDLLEEYPDQARMQGYIYIQR